MADFSAESILNREDDTLPYAYYNPETEGKLTWVCGQDSQGKITSVFCMDLGTEKDKKCQYLDNIEQAKIIRKDLVDNGWLKLQPPKIEFRFPGEKNPRQLTRKEKRYLKKKVEKLNKQNPFV